MKDYHNKELDTLFDAVLKLKSVEECYDFFNDLCTMNEIILMQQRYSVARLLDNGEKFGDIETSTGASSATISRVNRCLKYGSGGYRVAIDRQKEDTK